MASKPPDNNTARDLRESPLDDPPRDLIDVEARIGRLLNLQREHGANVPSRKAQHEQNTRRSPCKEFSKVTPVESLENSPL
jgi:hypothetical protein